jgi:hypothetical protein
MKPNFAQRIIVAWQTILAIEFSIFLHKKMILLFFQMQKMVIFCEATSTNKMQKGMEPDSISLQIRLCRMKKSRI